VTDKRESISFDRAAAYYDATRALPDDLAQAITEAILAEVERSGASHLLEIGIGTGRMARPLLQRGVPVVGVDISAPMMEQLERQLTAEHRQPDLLLGDATRLPFRDASFNVALAVHVLHLVASARDAIAEIRRVLTPGGAFLQQIRRPDEETQRTWDEHDEFWAAACRSRGVPLRQRPDTRVIDAILTESGARLRELTLSHEDNATSVEEEMEHLIRREFSWMWLVPDEILEQNLVPYQAWLRARAPDGVLVDRITYSLQVATWPGS
jgi:ubiquinone/menaquinone biosynthesis C-methylase UbiE